MLSLCYCYVCSLCDVFFFFFFFSSRRRHTRLVSDWSSDVCSSDLRVAGRPVKLMLSRREMYYGTGYRPHTVQRLALGAARDGHLVAILNDAYQETSSYEEYSEALVDASRFLYS